MLQAAQRAVQHAPVVTQHVIQQAPPQIHVVIDQTPGTPEWIKLLISGAVGLIFGLMSSILMEYVKPLIMSGKIRKEAKKEVSAELIGNLNLVSSLWNYFSSGNPESNETEVIARTLLITQRIKRDRYGEYFENHKAVLYSIDSQKKLASFYESLDDIQAFVAYRKPLGILAATDSARTQGTDFLTANGIEYQPEPTIYDKMNEIIKKGLWPPSGTPGA